MLDTSIGCFLRLNPEYRSIRRKDPTMFSVDYNEWARMRTNHNYWRK